MKKSSLLLVFVFGLLFANGQETYRSSMAIESNQCFILWGELESSKPNFITKVFEELKLGSSLEGVNYSTLDKLERIHIESAHQTQSKGIWLFFQTPIVDQEVDIIALSNNLLSTSDKVFVNGKEIVRNNRESGFYADIKPMVETGHLALLAYIDSVHSTNDIVNKCKGFSLDGLRGVFIYHASMLKNSLLGSYSAEVQVSNLLEKDIDGKLIARILHPETLDVIDENNNCAFALSGSESEVEVSFLNESAKLLPGKYLLEVVLVDKENNEEVIDQSIKAIIVQ